MLQGVLLTTVYFRHPLLLLPAGAAWTSQTSKLPPMMGACSAARKLLRLQPPAVLAAAFTWARQVCRGQPCLTTHKRDLSMQHNSSCMLGLWTGTGV
jgi:hypothetical protein